MAGFQVSTYGRFWVLTEAPGLETAKPGLEFLIERERSRGAAHYRMRPETRDVIESLKSLRDVIARPVDEIRTAFEDERDWLVVRR